MPSTSLFLSTLFLGTSVSLSASNWLYVWLGLELNLMSFVPLLTASPQSRSSEAAMIYFLAQALGSGLLLLGSLSIFLSPQLFLPSYFHHTLIFLGLLTKLGLPPCHFWFPTVMSQISWPLCLLLTTWQKLTPLAILFYILPPSNTLMFILTIILGSLISALGGLNQTQLRPLLAYSSIGHMTWMLVAANNSTSTSLLYLLIYILTTLPLILLLWSSYSYSNLSSSNMTSLSPSYTPSIFILILSLGGLPPFLGFFPKWLVVESLAPTFTFLILVTLLGSLMNLYYYMNLVFINILTPSKFPMIQTSSPLPTFSTLTILTTLTLGLAPAIML
uniref:NADH-ubiquinone oxidoreductase chain 2 n=1 Tax=Levensteiniella iris TaxID=2153341 RepID=A0A343W663_9ANNE|nr:NADH dehydrogenase subunit 2 [Levensteiniella iris]